MNNKPAYLARDRHIEKLLSTEIKEDGDCFLVNPFTQTPSALLN